MSFSFSLRTPELTTVLYYFYLKVYVTFNIQKSVKVNITKPKDMPLQWIKSYRFATLLNLQFISPRHIFILFKYMVIYSFTNSTLEKMRLD